MPSSPAGRQCWQRQGPGSNARPRPGIQSSSMSRRCLAEPIRAIQYQCECKCRCQRSMFNVQCSMFNVQCQRQRQRQRWTVMGRFWSADCTQRVKRIIFRSMVWSTLLTGWGTLLPSRADCRAFDKFTACKGRSLMRGWIDAEEKRDTTRLLRQKS